MITLLSYHCALSNNETKAQRAENQRFKFNKRLERQ